MKSTTALSVLALASSALAHPAPKAPKITDIDILQYALTLEHLEDTFYRQGLANFTLKDFEAAGYNATFYSNLKEIAYDEKTHVSFLSSALKSLNTTPVAECTYAFGVTSVPVFLATASILEGVGVSAYLGAAASIVDKTYLTAAGSILTVESRHSAYLRAAQHESPFPQAFDAPLDFNQVYTLAAPFIVSCPKENGQLPVKAFPSLTLETAAADVKTNATVTFAVKEAIKTDTKLFAAWVSVTGPVYTAVEWVGDKKAKTSVPVGFHGQSYVVLNKGDKGVTDESVLAGPAIVEIARSNGGN